MATLDHAMENIKNAQKYIYFLTTNIIQSKYTFFFVKSIFGLLYVSSQAPVFVPQIQNQKESYIEKR